MMKPLKCNNCDKIIGETNTEYKLAKEQVVSCGDEKCDEIVFEKAKEIFKRTS